MLILQIFLGILAFALLVTALAILFAPEIDAKPEARRLMKWGHW